MFKNKRRAIRLTVFGRLDNKSMIKPKRMDASTMHASKTTAIYSTVLKSVPITDKLRRKYMHVWQLQIENYRDNREHMNDRCAIIH